MSGDRYAAELAEIRKRRTHVWLAPLGLLPVAAAAIPLARALGFEDEGAAATFGAVAWALVFFAVQAHAAQSPCPRCEKPFFSRRRGFWSASNLLARRCLNCGLELKAEPRNGPPAR